MTAAPGSISVTVDIEDWYHIPSVCGSPFSVYPDVKTFFENWHERYDYLTKPTMRVLEILDQYQIKATFFVVADVVDHYPGLVESIADHGHEIACHGLHHACKIDSRTKEARFGKDEFEAMTKKAKNILEKASGQKVVGYRAPNALIGGWMLDSLEKLGFGYDSSVCVNSFYNKSDLELGSISSYPYQVFEGNHEDYNNLLEYPWNYWKILGIKVPTGGGPVLRFMGANIILKGLKQSIARGHSVFYFHPLDIADDTFPKLGHGRPMYWSIKGNIVEKRIRHILSNCQKFKKLRLKDASEENNR